jgi:hypothetical protein
MPPCRGNGSTHWSVRTLAAHLRVSRTIRHRVWQRHGAQPHRVERFKLSNSPPFEAKVRDVVVLYLDPPDRALVLCVDEKSQIQVLRVFFLARRPGKARPALLDVIESASFSTLTWIHEICPAEPGPAAN